VKLVVVVAALAACNSNEGAVSSGTQSLRIELVSPADPGDVNHRMPGSPAPSVIVNVTALDVDGNLDPTFDRDVYAYAQFLGTLTPDLGSVDPLATFHVTQGKSTDQEIQLPIVFGPTTIWIDDGQNDDPTYATGTSPTLWFNDPFIKDIQQPANEQAIDALSNAPLDSKNVQVNASRYGANGRLVITSVFAQGYTVADVNCKDAAGTPPCVAGNYDAVEVFSFSAPLDADGRFLKEGQVIDGFAGGVSEFDGLTEIGFPQTFVNADPVDVNTMREPTPVKVDASTWFLPLTDPSGGMIQFERQEALPIEIDGAKVCNLDSDFDTFNQWKLDPSGVGGDCSSAKNLVNVITAGVISDLDPSTLVGQTLPKVVGILRPLNIGSFNVWIIYPRSHADLTLQ
jgi:hypothetical protein